MSLNMEELLICHANKQPNSCYASHGNKQANTLYSMTRAATQDNNKIKRPGWQKIGA